jgi:hypothetical protein
MIAELASRPVILTVDTAGLLSGVVLAEDLDVVVVGPEVLLTDVRDGLDFEVDEPIDGDVVSGWRDEIEDEGFELVSDDEGVLVYRRER